MYLHKVDELLPAGMGISYHIWIGICEGIKEKNYITIKSNEGYINSSSHKRRQTVLTKHVLCKSDVSRSEST